jgi:uncharacterized membrane protein
MNASLVTWGTGAAAVGAGIIGGVFYAFSTFIMRALARLTPAEGVRAMQAINVTVLSPMFLGAFVGVAVLCGALAVTSIVQWGAPGSGLRLSGALLYVVGTFGVTMAFNVPRNEVLVKLDPEAAAVETAWRTYVDEWTSWNHVRTAAAVAATVALLAAAASRP